MRLSPEQLQAFDRDGYLFFPGLFTPEEIRTLTDEVPALYAQRRPENVREKTGDVVRTNFAAHLYSYPFAKLARHPRMVEPVRQLFGEDVYMHQFKINGKAAFDGDVWQWHQDYGTWRADIEHQPWPLQPAAAEIAENTMTRPLGIELPARPPLLHWAERLDVRVWSPRRVLARAAAEPVARWATGCARAGTQASSSRPGV